MWCFPIPTILLPRPQMERTYLGAVRGVAMFGQQQTNMAAISAWSQNGGLTQVESCKVKFSATLFTDMGLLPDTQNCGLD